MQQLITFYRLKQLLAHNMHNLTARTLFFSEHEVLGELYKTAEGNYDDVVERMIGLSLPINLVEVQSDAVEMLKTIPMFKDNTDAFTQILEINKEILQLIEQLAKSGISQGTLNLLAGQADALEVENYKLQQRIKK